jgi:hypothetical protein
MYAIEIGAINQRSYWKVVNSLRGRTVIPTNAADFIEFA